MPFIAASSSSMLLQAHSTFFYSRETCFSWTSLPDIIGICSATKLVRACTPIPWVGIASSGWPSDKYSRNWKWKIAVDNSHYCYMQESLVSPLVHILNQWCTWMVSWFWNGTRLIDNTLLREFQSEAPQHRYVPDHQVPKQKP